MVAGERCIAGTGNAGESAVGCENSHRSTTAKLAAGHPAVCAFVNDDLGAETLQVLAEQGFEIIALRCAGFNQVDIEAATRLGIDIARVPAYSPHAVAEHAGALLLSLNRKVHRAHQRIREGNFSLGGHIGHLVLDVYEEQGDLFFEDLSERVIDDDVFMRLVTFPNVLIPGQRHDVLVKVVRAKKGSYSQPSQRILPRDNRLLRAADLTLPLHLKLIHFILPPDEESRSRSLPS